MTEDNRTRKPEVAPVWVKSDGTRHSHPVQVTRGELADAMIASDALSDDTRAEARVAGSSQREPFLMFADAVMPFVAQPVQVKPSRKVPHTGPGHAAGDPGWCEGCYAELQPVQVEDTDMETVIAGAMRKSDDENHEQLCACSLWPESCATYGDTRPWSHDAEFVARTAIAALGGGDQ